MARRRPGRACRALYNAAGSCAAAADTTWLASLVLAACRGQEAFIAAMPSLRRQAARQRRISPVLSQRIAHWIESHVVRCPLSHAAPRRHANTPVQHPARRRKAAAGHGDGGSGKPTLSTRPRVPLRPQIGSSTAESDVHASPTIADMTRPGEKNLEAHRARVSRPALGVAAVRCHCVMAGQRVGPGGGP
jgi:hypothetical protein